MKSNIMITDGGPHSVEKWAEATASQVIDIAEDAAGERRAQAVKLEAAIIDILSKGTAQYKTENAPSWANTVQNGTRMTLILNTTYHWMKPLQLLCPPRQ